MSKQCSKPHGISSGSYKVPGYHLLLSLGTQEQDTGQEKTTLPKPDCLTCPAGWEVTKHFSSIWSDYLKRKIPEGLQAWENRKHLSKLISGKIIHFLSS